MSSIKYLEGEQVFEIVKESHKRAKNNDVFLNLESSLIKLEKSELKKLINDNAELIHLFRKLTKRIMTLYSNKYLFILTDPQLILLDYVTADNKEIDFLEKGISFKNESVGTNALSIAEELKLAVYLEPEQHYINYLKKWYCFAMPIIINDRIIAYIDVSGISKEIKGEMLIITKLLAESIIGKVKDNWKGEANLSKKHINILKCLAKGLTEQSVANEMGIAVSTVKYHKRNIFEELQVTCSSEAVAKAIKLEII
ncbi:helix-turn-helix transcriptional regulator [Natronospora cellulosivora (SeqCode)]